MKRVIKYLFIIAFVICLFTPQSTNSYEFSSKQRESQVRETRREIYTLYDMRKEMLEPVVMNLVNMVYLDTMVFVVQLQ